MILLKNIQIGYLEARNKTGLYEVVMETESKEIMYLGNCDELDCEHWSWCGDSYGDRYTECFCRVNGARVYRADAEEERILCPLGKTFDEDF